MAHCGTWVCSTGSGAAVRADASPEPATPRAPAPRRCGRPTAPDEEHLRNFVTARRGVEGFVEPRTAVSDVTLLLVAHDGEWTRRRVPSVAVGARVRNKHQVPSYDAAVVGIPQRMRDYNRRKKLQGDL